MKYLLLFLVSLSAEAAVCLDIACAVTKPLSQMQGGDLAIFCEDYPLCKTIKTLPWSNFQDYSRVRTSVSGIQSWQRRDAVTEYTPTIPPPFVAVPARCFPAPLGSGTKYTWEALVAGENRYTQPSMIVWGCIVNNQYRMVAYTGTPAKRAEELANGIASAFLGDILPLTGLTVSAVTRPLSSVEENRRNELWASLNLPALAPIEIWTVKTNGILNSRTAYRLVGGALGSSVGKVEIRKPCDCGLKFSNSQSTYCGVGGLLNFGTTKALPADAVTICVK